MTDQTKPAAPPRAHSSPTPLDLAARTVHRDAATGADTAPEEQSGPLARKRPPTQNGPADAGRRREWRSGQRRSVRLPGANGRGEPAPGAGQAPAGPARLVPARLAPAGPARRPGPAVPARRQPRPAQAPGQSRRCRHSATPGPRRGSG